ncbi:diguanylate cyclase [Pseudodesulfovibrio cashew]|uniref:diguanylate cyclase n=1 Tax=Pseudodesulfovibrio cashew TaxID=2678688 RepID=A0A6I6JN00_9BACT|nr:diguanylate cyclase [Pseudodesulfovibrio cashew]QGY39074.1 diguanylate cyclase [Pseudodesulfovibrio cashew]
MSIKARLLTALSVILVAAFVTSSLINYYVTRRAVRAELLTSSLPLTGKNIYSEIHSAMMRPILVSSSMASDTFLQDWALKGENVDEITKYLSEIQTKYGFLTAFFVSSTTDRYFYQNGVLKKVGPRDPHDVWYYSFVRTNREYRLDVDTNEAEQGKLTIFINYRVEDSNGRLLGVTGVGVSMDRATAMLAQAKRQYHRNVYLVDRDGLVQVDSDKSRIRKTYITMEDGIRDVAASILIPREDAANFEYEHDGRRILLSTSYIPEFSWHLIVEQDEGEALVTARSNLARSLIIGLASSILIIIVCMITVNHFQKRLERMAKTDPLTGAANRHAMEERFELSSYRAGRYGETFSVILLDLDDFKAINDRHGHLEGDRVLRDVARTIRDTIRPGDLLARWGGDEFLILMDGAPSDAEALAERVREALTSPSMETPVAFSCGIAGYRNGDGIDVLTQRADRALYLAKADGGGNTQAE